jgi:HEAT repeat protein
METADGNVNVSGRLRSRRTLAAMTLVLFVLLVILTTKGWRLSSRPAAAAARKLSDPKVSQRIAAIRDLERFGSQEPETALAALTMALKDTEPQVRTTAAEALVLVVQGAVVRGAARDEVQEGVAALVNGLGDSDTQVRGVNLRALAMLALLVKRPVPGLELPLLHDRFLKALEDPDPVVRVAAVRGLGSIGPKVSEDPPTALLGALEDSAGPVRGAAVESLDRFPDGMPRTLPSLVTAFERARPEFRPAYVAVFEQIRPERIRATMVPALATALGSSDDEIRCLAARAFARLGAKAQPAIPALAASIARPGRVDAEAIPRASSMVSYYYAGPPFPWIPPQTSKGRSTLVPVPPDGPDPALAAAWALLWVSPEFPFESLRTRPPLDTATLSVLTDVLRSGTPRVRATVAAALGRFVPTPAVVPILGEAVRDQEAAVRASALRALHDIGDTMPFTPPPSVHDAFDDESPVVRYWAAGAVGHAWRGIDPFVPILLRVAEQDPDAQVREVCASEVRYMIRPPGVTPAVIPALSQALDGPNLDVRWAACGLLSRFGPAAATAVPGIVRALDDATPKPGEEPHLLFWEASSALGRIAPSTPEAGPAAAALVQALRASPGLPIIDALARLGPVAGEGIPQLKELGKSTNQAMREAAQKALAAVDTAKPSSP